MFVHRGKWSSGCALPAGGLTAFRVQYFLAKNQLGTMADSGQVRYGPPVIKITLPERSGISVSGLKVTPWEEKSPKTIV